MGVECSTKWLLDDSKRGRRSYYYLYLKLDRKRIKMLPASKKYIQIPSKDYLKIKRMLEEYQREQEFRAKTLNRYCPDGVNHPTRSEQRVLEINKLLTELELHSRLVEDY